MTSNQFHIVDVFAEQRFAGNQLGVVEVRDSLSTEEMQHIAREFNFSETTFIESPDTETGGYDVRIFTPKEEIPFAGHPTLGTAFVIRKSLANSMPAEVTLNLKVGKVPVRMEGDAGDSTMWMTQQPPDFRQYFRHDAVARVLGLETDALDHDWPVQAVSTGLPTVIVPLESSAALERISVDRDEYDEFVADHEAKNLLAFCSETRQVENDLAVRVFAPFYGVPEDPATGSSNGCLAAYLAEYEYYGLDSVDIRVEQGYAMGRPSLLYLRSDASGSDVTVQVGGQVIPIAQGEFVAV